MLPSSARNQIVIIWDLDGTLADTGKDILRALNAVLAENELPHIDPATLRHLVGHGARALIQRALAHFRTAVPDTRLTAMTDRLVALYAEAPTANTDLFDGIAEVMDWIARQGWDQAIATNKPRRLTELVLDGLSISHHFTRVICPEDVAAKKPDAAHVLAARGDGCHAVMIGDSETDYRAARAAGIDCVLVEWGYSDVPITRFKSAAHIKNAAELKELLPHMAHGQK